MPTFVVLIPDSKILEEVASFKSVVLVGCPHCPNSSIAYEKNIPVHKISVDNTSGRSTWLPIAMIEETNRLKNLLEIRGINVRVEIGPPLCILTPHSELQMGGGQWAIPELANRCANAEAVITFSCAGGTLGVEKRLGKTVKIIPAMRTIGWSQLYLILDEAKKLAHIDTEKSTIIRMSKD